MEEEFQNEKLFTLHRTSHRLVVVTRTYQLVYEVFRSYRRLVFSSSKNSEREKVQKVRMQVFVKKVSFFLLLVEKKEKVN